MNEYTLVAGLETHIELSCKSKIFCSCKTAYGDAPNSNCCPICLGLPGSLPSLNKEAVLYAIKMGLALGCKISSFSHMDRKNYIYPDLVKAYQISQDKMPLCTGGALELGSGKKIYINRIHIEEDAGKLIHGKDGIFIDYNRAGVPLIEIVTEPCFESSEQIREYLEAIRLIAKYLGISTCKMEEGAMRSDVNVSVTLNDVSYDRCEIKNMNSFANITKAIDAEFERQKAIIENGGHIEKQTLRYDEDKNITYPMRSKETDADYRFFKEPDIPCIKVFFFLISCK